MARHCVYSVNNGARVMTSIRYRTAESSYERIETGEARKISI